MNQSVSWEFLIKDGVTSLLSSMAQKGSYTEQVMKSLSSTFAGFGTKGQEAIAGLNDDIAKFSKPVQDATKSIENLEAHLATLNKDFKTSVSRKEMEKLNVEIQRTEKELKQLKELGKKSSLDILEEQAKEATGAIAKLEAQLAFLSEKKRNARAEDLKDLNAEIDKTQRNLQQLNSMSHGKSGPMGKGKGLAQFGEGALDAIPGLSMVGNPYAMAGLAAGTIAIAAGSKAMDYDYNMARVNATLLKDDKGRAALSKELLHSGAGIGISQTGEIPLAFNKLVSSGLSEARAMEILRPTLKAAAAGFNDVTDTAEAMAGVFANLPNVDPTHAMNVMFAAMNRGNVEFKDMAQYFPQIISYGKSVGFTFEDMAGAFSYYTAKGNDAMKASTLMTNFFTAMSRKDTKNALEKMGVPVYEKMADGSVKMRSMITLMEELDQRLDKLAGKNESARATLLEGLKIDAQAATAIATATADVEALRNIAADTNTGLINGQQALDATYKATESSARSWAATQYKINEMLTKLGEKLLPTVDNGISKIDRALSIFEGKENALSKIFEVALKPLGEVGKALDGLLMVMEAMDKGFDWLGSRVNMKAKPSEPAANPIYEGMGVLQGFQGGVGSGVLMSSQHYAVPKQKVFQYGSPNLNLEGSDVMKELSKAMIPKVESPEQFAAKKSEKGIAISDAVPNDEKKKRGSGGGIDAVGFSSQRPQSVTVTIQNIHVMENAHYNNVHESLPDLGRAITEHIVNAVRDAELALG